MHTPDLAAENYKKLAALFPNAVTETITGYDENGKPIVERAIDADVLRQEISAQVVEGPQERYQFTWPDKKKSVVLANQPIAKTLRLDREKSVGRDGTLGGIDTENIYIEGDNLDALKLLQETYLGKVKMIYIDPPYNTGSDFIYEDDFSQELEGYITDSGQFDEIGNRLVQNLESGGRYHTNWLNMMYVRLRVAKDLLSSDGCLVMSIGRHEIVNLMKICREMFSNRQVVCVTVQTSGGKPSGGFNYLEEYLIFIVPYEFSARKLSKWGGNERTPFEGLTLSTFDKTQRPNQTYPIFVNKETGVIVGVGASLQEKINTGIYVGNKEDYEYDYSCAPEGCVAIWPVTSKGKDCVWRQIPDRILHDWKKGYIKVTKNNGTGNKNKFSIQYLPSGIISKIENGSLEIIGHEKGLPTLILGNNLTEGGQVPSIWLDKEFFTVHGTRALKELFPEFNKAFDYPKPISLIQDIIQACTSNEDIIMDFFSGSATTAHAVMKLNSEDYQQRKFILVQLPEESDQSIDVYKAGYKNLCDIGEERIRRAGRKIREESPLTTADLDIGFRVFRVDSSNMEDVYYRPAEVDQGQMNIFADNIKKDRTPEDLLFQVMLDLGVLLSSKIEETVIAGKKVFSVADGYLIACFDKDVTDETVKAIALKHPFYAVFRDAGMASDSVMTNFEQIFETYSPRTQRKVL